MTCIVGLKHGEKVYIGGDSAGVSGYDITVRADEKVFKNGNFLMGFTTSFRMGQLLRYAFTPPDHDPRVEIDKFMVKEFVEAVRGCMHEGGFARIKDSVESGGTFLVGYKGELFCIADDFQVGKAVDGYMAVGCAENVALGVLYATEKSKMSPVSRVTLALQAAEKFSGGVRSPFHILSI